MKSKRRAGTDVDDLRQRFESYRMLVEGLPDIVIRFGTDGKHLFVSDNVSDVVDMEASDFVGKTHRELGFPEEMCAYWEQVIRKVVETGLSSEEVFALEGKKGSRILDWRLVPEFDGSGRVTSVLSVSRDVTAERREERLKASQLRLMEFADTHGIEELVQRFLDEAEALTGSRISFCHFLSDDEKSVELNAWSSNTVNKVCDLSLATKHYPADEGGVWTDCMRERAPVIHNDYASLPHKHGLPDGHVPLVRELVLPVMREQKIVAIVGVGNKTSPYDQDDVSVIRRLSDLTWEMVVRRRTEQALRESEKRLKDALLCNNDGVFEFCIATHETYYDANYYKMAGYEPYEYPPAHEEWQKRVHPEDLPAVQQVIDDFLAGRTQTFDRAFRFLRKDGAWMWIRSRVKVVEMGTDGAPLRVIGTHTDITRQKRAEEESARLNSQLAQKNKSLEQLVYVTSHDLRSPLLNVAGHVREVDLALKLLRDEARKCRDPEALSRLIDKLLEGDTAESLHFIRSGVKRMDLLLGGLLELSRSGREPLFIQSVDMNRVLSAVIEAAEFQIRQSGIDIQVSRLPVCRGDVARIERVFSNLLSNAVKYRDPERAGVIKVWGEALERESIYHVEDNGIGIAEEDFECIFDACVRVDPRSGEGDGLGLTIVKESVERLNGRAWVTSELGKGSCFHVSLPSSAYRL